MIDCGPHAGSGRARRRARKRFRETAERIYAELQPRAIVATCPFSYLEALRLARGRTPVIYFVEEIYEVNARAFFRSPLTGIRNWRAERRLGEASLVAAPSDERAAFIGASARLPRVPHTVLNCPYIGLDAGEIDEQAIEALLPRHFQDGVLVVNTGRVSETQGIIELVESVADWPREARLVITSVGDSAYAKLVREQVDRSPRRNDICLLPMLPRAAMLALQKRADVGICLLRRTSDPTTHMPAPNKVGEYLQWGMVIVASRLPFLSELEKRDVGELTNEIDPGQIAHAVRRAVERARRRETRAHVRSVALGWLNMEVQAAPILALVENGNGRGVA